MPIPAANVGSGVIVTPLSRMFSRDYMAEPANGEQPVKQAWFNGGDVATIVIRPEIKRDGIPDPVVPQKQELNVRKFFPGGAN